MLGHPVEQPERSTAATNPFKQGPCYSHHIPGVTGHHQVAHHALPGRPHRPHLGQAERLLLHCQRLHRQWQHQEQVLRVVQVLRRLEQCVRQAFFW